MKTVSSARSTNSAASGNNHYVVLDGLRGVASLMVLAFQNTLEPFSHGDATKQIIKHLYLAVDFFFVLSGFVISYTYGDRRGRMTQWGFYKRRLIRLQPVVSSWEI